MQYALPNLVNLQSLEKILPNLKRIFVHFLLQKLNCTDRRKQDLRKFFFAENRKFLLRSAMRDFQISLKSWGLD